MDPRDSAPWTDPPRGVRRAITIFSFAALLLSVYMVWQGGPQHGHLPGCSGGSQCDAVLGSRWARWSRFPVAVLGVGCYLGMTGLSLLAGVKKLQSHAANLWGMMVMLSLTGLVFVAWLTGLQWLALKHFCLYCMTAHLFGFTAFYLVLRYAPVWRTMPRAPLRLGVPAGILSALLIGSHVLLTPGIVSVEAAEEMQFAETDDSSFSGGSIRLGRKPTPRIVHLLDGNLTFNLEEVPLIGPADAPHVIVDLFDYPCPSCRELHGILQEFRKKHPGRIAVVPLPVPMNRDCNPNVKRTLPTFNDSCDYARYSMAVRQAAPEKFEEYHEWLLTGGWPPPVDKARERAESLVGGKEKLASLLEEEAGEHWIRDGINIYRFIQARSIPRLIVGDTVITYGSGSKRKLLGELEERLGISPED